MDKLNVAPCGGSPKGYAHLITSPGLRNIFQIRTVKGRVNATCKFRLGYGTDSDSSFFDIFPADGSADKDGKFPCGRYNNYYENKEFIFPEDLSCDNCTIQLISESIGEKLYQ